MTAYRQPYHYSRVCRVHEDTYKRLKALKGPGDSFGDVVERLLDAVGRYDREGEQQPFRLLGKRWQ